MCVLVGLLSVSGGCAQCRDMCACLWDDLVCAVGVHSSGTRMCACRGQSTTLGTVLRFCGFLFSVVAPLIGLELAKDGKLTNH